MTSSVERRARPRNLAQRTRYWGGRITRFFVVIYVSFIFVFAVLTLAFKAIK